MNISNQRKNGLQLKGIVTVQIHLRSRKSNDSSGVSPSTTFLFTSLAQMCTAQSIVQSLKLGRTPRDSQITVFPPPPNATHLPWILSSSGGSRPAVSPLSLTVCFIPFIPNTLQGWGELPTQREPHYAWWGLQDRAASPGQERQTSLSWSHWFLEIPVNYRAGWSGLKCRDENKTKRKNKAW